MTDFATASRRIQFCAGHRVYGHESRCANLHGHNYVGYFEASAPTLDGLGRIVDFSVLKTRIGDWIDTHLDHGFVYWQGDFEVRELIGPASAFKTKVLEVPFNPTAENLAIWLCNEVCPHVLSGTRCTVHLVRLYETENCYATARKLSQNEYTDVQAQWEAAYREEARLRGPRK